MPEFNVILITTPNHQTASDLAKGLIDEYLATCVNIIPGIESIYRWEGKIQTDQECLMICKTMDTQWDTLVSWVKAHHPYEVPEIIQLPILAGSESYLQWLQDGLKK